MKLERFDLDFGRQEPVFLVEIDSLDEFPTSYDWPTQHIRVLSIMDSSAMSRDAISAFADRLMDHHCTVFHAAGNDCERVHDLYDQWFWERETRLKKSTDEAITIWHTDDPLEEYMWEFLYLHTPFDDFEETTGSCVVVVNDDHELANRIRDIFTGKDCDWMDRLDDIESQSRSPAKFITGVIMMLSWPIRALGGRSRSDIDNGCSEDDQ